MTNRIRTNITSDSQPTVVPKYLTKQEFGRRVYSLMLGKGWNQSELARQSGLTRDSISTYVRGKTLPTPQNLAALAKAFDLAPEELLPNYVEGAVADEENPSFEMRVSNAAPGTAWLRVNRLVKMTSAIAIATILEDDHVFDGGGNGAAAAVQPVKDKASPT